MMQVEGKDIAPHFPGAIETYVQEENCFTFHTKTTLLKVVVLSDTIIRFRFANDCIFENDFSYAVDNTAIFHVESINFYEEPSYFAIVTAQLKCLVSKADSQISIFNNDGLIIFEDEKGFHWIDDPAIGGKTIISSKKIQEGENYFGLGDKSTDLNLSGKRFQIWASDHYGFGKETDPLYKNIPFFLGLHHNISYGVFFDNTFRSFFDFGFKQKNILNFSANGGEMNYYFIYGPQMIRVAENYTMLTGLPKLPPLWALGYHQSKWSYFPESVVTNLAAEFRKRKIPCDAIHLDIDYMDGYRCFTWNKIHFPNPKRMIADLQKDGFKIMTIVNPGIKIDKNYPVYQNAVSNDIFCKTADGPLYKGSVWPGLCHFPDFTNAKVREWWGELLKDWLANGIKGIWNDMNEPTAFEEGTFPPDVRHDFDGHPCDHMKAHNVYGFLMAKASWDGLKKFSKTQRPFNITRSAFSGVQRYAAVWTGDNVANWEHMRIANIQCQRLSLSGVSFTGSDIGGFVEDSNGELYTRWIQMSVFHPFFRTHTSGDHLSKEPWSFGPQFEAIIKSYIELRYRLLPYIYTTFWQYSTFGTPMIRSLHLLDQEDEQTYHKNDEFGFGDHILTCPICKSEADGIWIYLPKGQWYNFWDDTFYSGSGDIWVEAPLHRMPIFISAGGVIPMNPIAQYVGEKSFDQIDLHIYFCDCERKSSFYEDAGDGYENEIGVYLLRTFEVSGRTNQLQIAQKKEGSFKVSYKTFRVVVHGYNHKARECMVDGKSISFLQDENHIMITIDENFNHVVII